MSKNDRQTIRISGEAHQAIVRISERASIPQRAVVDLLVRRGAEDLERDLAGRGETAP